jgi:hypothetical protein
MARITERVVDSPVASKTVTDTRKSTNWDPGPTGKVTVGLGENTSSGFAGCPPPKFHR